MNLGALFPPTLVSRVLDDLGAIAEAARRLPELEAGVLQRLDAMRDHLAAVQRTLAPIQQLPAVRTAVEPLSGQLADLGDKVEPIQEIRAVRRAVEPLRDQLEGASGTVEGIRDQLGALDALRAGIEPLDDDMRTVRDSVDELEPLLRLVNKRLGALDTRLEALRTDLAPVGEAAGKIPGVG